MARQKIEYGIDLGTTNSGIARMEHGISTILEIDNSKTVPSVVLFDRRDNPIVGITAYNSTKPKFVEFKRDMGKKELQDNSNAQLSNGTKITPEFLSSQLLKKLKERVNDEVFKSVVITVPAMFDLGQVDATKRAAKLAGFEQVDILMEPVAAATAFGRNNLGKNGNWLIFDFGGGTFDASIVKSEDGIMKVIGSEGDNKLGGGDLDRSIINDVILPVLKKNYNIDNLIKDKSSILYGMLKVHADQIKKDLSFKDEVDFLSDLDAYGNDEDGKEIELEHKFTVDDVCKLFEPIFKKAIDCVKVLLKRKKLTINEIDELILVGGPTQIPMFRKMIEKELMKPNCDLNPMTAVAEGAAIYAANINNQISDHGNKIGGEESDDEIIEDLIEVNYEANCVTDVVPVSIIKKDKSKKIFAIIEKDDGSWKSVKQELDDVFELENLNRGVNKFLIKLFDESSGTMTSNISEIIITHGVANPKSSLPYFIGIDVADTRRNRTIFRSLKGLEVDNPLPAIGLSKPNGDLFTPKEIRPGVEEDKLKIKIYQAASNAEGSRSILNKYSGLEFEINGSNIPKLIPANSIIHITINVSVDQTIKFEAEFPELDLLIDDLPPAEIKAQESAQLEQIDFLFKEAHDIIENLSSSLPLPPNLNEMKEQFDSIKDSWEKNKDSDQTYNNLQSLVLKLDVAIDKLEWPKLQDKINESLKVLEDLVSKCETQNLKGNQEDRADLNRFKDQFKQVKDAQNQDLGQKLFDEIQRKDFEIRDRHAGKEQAIMYIRSFNQQFQSVKWRNKSVARIEVDKGMQMINTGASEGELKNQLGIIFSQMIDPNQGFGDDVIRN
tara:strand:+ start:8781 stop:11288 length:2508 start_codon:yes stop_codon:yes gene_type:complete